MDQKMVDNNTIITLPNISESVELQMFLALNHNFKKWVGYSLVH